MTPIVLTFIGGVGAVGVQRHLRLPRAHALPVRRRPALRRRRPGRRGDGLRRGDRWRCAGSTASARCSPAPRSPRSAPCRCSTARERAGGRAGDRGAGRLRRVWSGVHLARYELAAFEHRAHQEVGVGRGHRVRALELVLAHRGPQGRTEGGAGVEPEHRVQGADSRSTTRWLQIDSIAGTQLVGFDGDFSTGRVPALGPAQLRAPPAAATRACAVVGAGGGRDMLTARLFGQRRVLAVELNGDIMRVVNRQVRRLTPGTWTAAPGVTFVNDDARSYLAREQEQFDIVAAHVRRHLRRDRRRRLHADRERALHRRGLEGVPRPAGRRRPASGLARRAAASSAGWCRSGVPRCCASARRSRERHMVLVTNRRRGRGSRCIADGAAAGAQDAVRRG